MTGATGLPLRHSGFFGILRGSNGFPAILHPNSGVHFRRCQGFSGDFHGFLGVSMSSRRFLEVRRVLDFLGIVGVSIGSKGFQGVPGVFSRFSWIHRGFDGFEATLSKFSGVFFSGGSKGFGRFSWIL